jgi:YfiH family protein
MTAPFMSEPPEGVLAVDQWSDTPWLLHGFTTRAAGDFTSPRARDELRSRWGAEDMQWESLRQVHSSRVHVLTDSALADPPSEQPEGDGLLTRRPGRLLSIRTADCLPLLFLDRRCRAIAAVHAGWRGTTKQITRRTVEKMERLFGSAPEELEVAIGPGIGACCYEVGWEVAERFPPSAVVDGERPCVDLVAANRLQLVEAGVAEGKIGGIPLCTRCRPGEFFSYRREGKAAGRMLAVIGIRPGESGSEPSPD